MSYVLVGLSMAFVISLSVNAWFINQVYQGLSRLARAEDDQTLTQSEVAYINSLLNDIEQEEEELMRIAVDTDSNKAYWISDQGLMWTSVEEDGSHDLSAGVVVDAHSMTDKEVNLLVHIVDALKDENYDEGSSTGEQDV